MIGLDLSTPAGRALNVALRTAHLGAMAVLAGGLWLGLPLARPWAFATVATGVALLVSEASHSRAWPWQLRGLAALLHVGIAALVRVEGLGRAAVAVALIVGAVGSHAPRGLRKWSIRERRVVD